MLRSLLFLAPFAAIGVIAIPAIAGPISGSQPKSTPAGELAQRINMNINRMSGGGIPEFSEGFILADVALRPDQPRRFSEYSGDLSGRYVEAFSCMSTGKSKEEIDKLVSDLISHQKPDGRFGDPDLKYSAAEIGALHMAQLWGNGRLLVGLVENYASNPRPEVLAAARKLGDFLLGVHAGCANKEVQAKVNDLAAAGMICFSQMIESFVLLSEATGDKAYLDGAEKVVPWLQPERAKQHSHGYLTTLRGILMLNEATHDPKYLSMVEDLYDKLVHSGDLTLYGGVQELFGGQWDRDEGCSEGDFLRLSLQLWRVTGKMEYLDRAEYCLQNQFFANQFTTGDFGHHCYTDFGEKAIPGVGRAWWCCTMHGLRAFRDVLDTAVTTSDNVVKINLYADVAWTDNGGEISVGTSALPDGKLRWSVNVKQAPQAGLKIAVRKPYWAETTSTLLNGAEISSNVENGYLVFDKPFSANGKLEVILTPRWEFVAGDGRVFQPSELNDNPTNAALRIGPWLMGVDEADNLMFFGEPWGANRVMFSKTQTAVPAPSGELTQGHLHVPCEYIHDGFFGVQQVTLRPIAERTGHEPMTFCARPKYMLKN